MEFVSILMLIFTFLALFALIIIIPRQLRRISEQLDIIVKQLKEKIEQKL